MTVKRTKRENIPKYYLRFKDIRLALGLKVQEMADVIGIPKDTYFYYENTEAARLPLVTLCMYALKLGLSIDYILGLTNIPDAYPSPLHFDLQSKLELFRVREFRMCAELSVKSVAQYMGITASSLSNKELHPEKVGFTMFDLITLSGLFATSIDYLIGLTDTETQYPRVTPKKEPISQELCHKIGQRIQIEDRSPKKDIPHKYTTIDFQVKNIRMAKGYTQLQIADILGLPVDTYEMLENSPDRFSIYALVKLADWYGITLDELVGRH